MSARPAMERPRQFFVLPRMVIHATLLALCLVGPAWSQHGGGGGHGGGFGGHGGFGHAGGGHANSGKRAGGTDRHSPGMHHRGPFRPIFSLFDRPHRRDALRVCEPLVSACGDAYGVVDCGLWDWRCPKPAPVVPVTNGPTSPAITSVAPLRNGSASATSSPGIQSASEHASSQGTSRALPVIWLKDGYSYELAAYSVQDGQLHYRTSYGGENSVPLDSIDFERTAQDNSERGAQFTVNPGGARGSEASAPSQH
jgi:hypothetical protein